MHVMRVNVHEATEQLSTTVHGRLLLQLGFDAVHRHRPHRLQWMLNLTLV